MKNNQGFTLIETMVALLILGILGLMASQGLGGAFRVKDSVEGQIKDQDSLVVMLKHLQNKGFLILTSHLHQNFQHVLANDPALREKIITL